MLCDNKCSVFQMKKDHLYKALDIMLCSNKCSVNDSYLYYTGHSL